MIKAHIIDRYVIFCLFLLLPLLSAINFQGKYTAISFLFVFSYIYYYRSKGLRNISKSYPLLLWFILTVYHWVNAMQKNVPEVNILDLLHGIKIFTCIAIFTYLARRNFDQTIFSLLVCFQIYLIITYLFNRFGSSGASGRLSGVVIATALGQTAAISGIYIAYYSIRKNLTIAKSSLLYVLPIAVILLTQSRNSLAMISIGIIGHAIALSSQRGLKISKVITTIVIILTASYFCFNFIINNTEIGLRLADTETAALSASNNGLSTGTIFDKIVGDRLVYYVKGWYLFINSPITGIGMWNYEYLSGGRYPLHSEYMVHLCEGGIIGMTIWLLFILSVFSGVLKCKIPTPIKIIALFSLFELMFCAVYARVFFYEFFFPVIGIALSFSSFGINYKRKRP